MHNKIALVSLVIVLGLVNWYIAGKEKHLAEGGIDPDAVTSKLSELAATVKVKLLETERTRVLLLRLCSTLVGCILVLLTDFDIFGILENAANEAKLSKLQEMCAHLNHWWVNALAGGVAAAAGSSYWHDQLGRVRGLKAAAGNIRALKG